MYSHIAYLILGTNLGNRNKNLSNARLEINGLPQTRILKKSKIFKSPAYGPIKQPFFFNLALEVETELLPLELLDHFQQIEKKLKREKDSHMKPRTIDIDIVFFDNEKIIIVNRSSEKIYEVEDEPIMTMYDNDKSKSYLVA